MRAAPERIGSSASARGSRTTSLFSGGMPALVLIRLASRTATTGPSGSPADGCPGGWQRAVAGRPGHLLQAQCATGVSHGSAPSPSSMRQGQRLGHASVVVTLTVYAHVLPGDQKRAASRFAELVEVA